mgnify:CR=1 FL=1
MKKDSYFFASHSSFLVLKNNTKKMKKLLHQKRKNSFSSFFLHEKIKCKRISDVRFAHIFAFFRFAA